MPKGSDNPFPSVLLAEGTTPSSPAASHHRIFVDSADDHLKRVDSAGTVKDLEALSSSSDAPSANTTGTANTMVDVTGVSISLAAGTWLLMASMSVQCSTGTYCVGVITDSANTVLGSGQTTLENGVTTLAITPTIVTPGSTTSYKLRFVTGRNDSVVLQNDTVNSNTVTRLVAVKIA